MECTCSLLVWLSLLLSVAFILLLNQKQSRQGAKKRPPGPPGLPVLGNMFDLGTIPHQTLYKLQPKYGPVLWLRLGSINTMVIQSAKAAAELFKNHDLSFCDRKCPVALTAHNYNQGSIAIGQYGTYWRMLRRLCTVELMTNKQITATACLRQKCVDDMVRYIEEDTTAARARGESGEVNLAHFLFLTGFNLVGNLVLSRDLLNSWSREGYEFYNAMSKITEWAGKPNIADFLPCLRCLDPQGIKRNMERDMGRAIKIIAQFVTERIGERKLGRDKAKDFLDVLLDYEGEGKEEPRKISFQNINIFVVEMFFGGSETTSTTTEWAMTELLREPKLMRQAKEELNQVVGPKRKVHESDIDQLPFLQAVIKETLRLHPVIPLLMPRNTLQDTNFMGYLIPKDTQVFVNTWAIGRDPDSWEDPLSFKPERFLRSNIDFKGQNFEFIPFGSGRRICVGMLLAHQVVHLTLASLLHTFDWELGSNSTSEVMDMNERMGVTVRKLIPLKAIPRNVLRKNNDHQI